MDSEVVQKERESAPDPEREYRALVRALRRSKGFKLFFVQCSPASGTELVGKIRQEFPQKQIQVLSLTEPVSNLYELIEALPDRDRINILFIQGLEYSLYNYEEKTFKNDPTERYSYSLKGVPQLLAHLNLGREQLAQAFPFSMVFLVPLFAVKYLIRRAPDFFDWRSGLFELPTKAEIVRQEAFRIIEGADYTTYCNLTPEERHQKILEIQAWLEEPSQTLEDKARLLTAQGKLFFASGSHESAFKNFNQALRLQPNEPDTWFFRGFALGGLGRHEEAIESYDQALQLQPNEYETWYFRGRALFVLNRYEEAIASFDQTLQLQPDDHHAWYFRGRALGNLDLYEEAIASFNQSLQLQPNDGKSYYNKAVCYGLQENVEQAILSLQQAIALNPQYREQAQTDSTFDRIRSDPRFQALLQEPNP
jgi:tetratricopeptide (TPR) repeat protein